MMEAKMEMAVAAVTASVDNKKPLTEGFLKTSEPVYMTTYLCLCFNIWI